MKFGQTAIWIGLLVFNLYLFTFPLYVTYPPLLQAIAHSQTPSANNDMPHLAWLDQVETPESVLTLMLHPVSYWDWGLTRLVFSALAFVPGRESGFNQVQIGWLIKGTLSAILAVGLYYSISLIPRYIDARSRLLSGAGLVILLVGLCFIIFSPFLGLLLTNQTPIWLNMIDDGFPLRLHLLIPPIIILLLLIVHGLCYFITPQVKISYRVTFLVTGIVLVQFMIGAGYDFQKSGRHDLYPNDLEQLADGTHRTESVVMPVPDWGTALRRTNHLLAYNNHDGPIHIWLDLYPSAQNLWPLTSQNQQRVWLFESQLRPTDSLGNSARLFGQEAFLLETHWLEKQGRLNLYALADTPLNSVPMNAVFETGITLVDFAVATASPSFSEPFKIQLTWHLAPDHDFTPSNPPIVGFIHLLSDAQNHEVIAQTDRVLIDYANHHQSPLQPGQTIHQGYALSIPIDGQPGPHTIIIGLYDALTQQRLVRVDDRQDDFVYLTTIPFDSH